MFVSELWTLLNLVILFEYHIIYSLLGRHRQVTNPAWVGSL